MSPIEAISAVDAAPSPRPLKGSGASGPDAQKAELQRLRRATCDFEGLFIAHLLKTMQNTIPKSEEGLFTGGDVLRDVGWDKVAQSMARSGGLGLADMLFDGLKDKVTTDPAAPDSAAATAPVPLAPPEAPRTLERETTLPRPLPRPNVTPAITLPLNEGTRLSDKGNSGT